MPLADAPSLAADPTRKLRPDKRAALSGALAALDGAALLDLQAAWRRLYRTHPPRKLSRELLALAVAWQLQAQAIGGLQARDARELASLASVRGKGGERPQTRRVRVRPGARLVREWGGVVHEVLVVDAGFVWRDQTWTSLSAIARAMTGARWSGPRFFGLDRAGRKEQAAVGKGAPVGVAADANA